MPRNLDLEHKISEAPDDFTSYVVYADWLIEQGDPRGELISLQRLNKKKEADELLAQHAEHFLGALRDYDDLLHLEWHMGFLRRASIANTPERFDGDGDSAKETHEALNALLASPSAVFLRELTIGILDFEGNDYGAVFSLLAEHPKPVLETLYVGAFSRDETELNWSSIGRTGPMWTPGVVPRLQKLTLRSGSMNLEGIHCPSLRELEIVTGGFDSKSLAALVATDWPNLHTLSLQLGREHDIKIEELEAIFDGARFPALKHLGLTNTMISDEIAAAIVKSNVVKQLETLDLTLGTLGDEGAQALVDGKAALKHLKRIDLSENWISKAMCSRLTGICDALFDADQQDDDGDRENRYIAAYE